MNLYSRISPSPHSPSLDLAYLTPELFPINTQYPYKVMSGQDQTLIDPALQAEDESYRSSLGGIYPSQGRAGDDENNSVGLEDEGYGARSHPHPGRAGDGSAGKKKRTSLAVAGNDEEGRKKSRQSRESILTRVLCQY